MDTWIVILIAAPSVLGLSITPTRPISRITNASIVPLVGVRPVAGAIGPRADHTLGHEAVGVIHKIGSAVSSRFKVGQRVAVNAITPCFHCDYCQSGYTSQCGGMLGGWKFANTKDGNMAEYFHVNDLRTRRKRGRRIHSGRCRQRATIRRTHWTATTVWGTKSCRLRSASLGTLSEP